MVLYKLSIAYVLLVAVNRITILSSFDNGKCLIKIFVLEY